MRILIIIVITSITPIVLAGDSTSSSVDLRDRKAIAVYDLFQKQSQQAQDVYAKSMAKAREQAITQLEKIHADLAKTTDRQETAAVQVVIDKLKADLTDPEKQVAATMLQGDKDKLAKVMAGTIWRQQGQGRITITLYPDFTLESSHVDGKAMWAAVDGRTIKMAPFSTRKMIEFKLIDDKTLSDGSGDPGGVFEFQRRRP